MMPFIVRCTQISKMLNVGKKKECLRNNEISRTYSLSLEDKAFSFYGPVNYNKILIRGPGIFNNTNSQSV